MALSGGIVYAVHTYDTYHFSSSGLVVFQTGHHHETIEDEDFVSLFVLLFTVVTDVVATLGRELDRFPPGFDPPPFTAQSSVLRVSSVLGTSTVFGFSSRSTG